MTRRFDASNATWIWRRCACLANEPTTCGDARLFQGNASHMNRVFLLSPAYAGGERARMIMNERAQFDLARKLRSAEGATIAEVFTFLSGLYFRGKIAYANVFAHVEN